MASGICCFALGFDGAFPLGFFKQAPRALFSHFGMNAVDYCQKDVVAVARLLLRFKGDTQPINDDDVILVK